MVSWQDRGWTFSRALLGLQANELHLCGEEGVVELIARICALTGDSLEIKRCARLSPLSAMATPVEGLKDVRPGDAVVVFSRKGVYSTREQIQRLTKLPCAIVSGSLPPETRKLQATRFNEDKGYVLVAMDNSTCRSSASSSRDSASSTGAARSIFKHARDPPDRGPSGPLRAGRRGTGGLVGALAAEDLNVVRRAVSSSEPVPVSNQHTVFVVNESDVNILGSLS
jgi:ATP-dependent RNA helicase SUPV3L1/SUV3